MLQDSLKEKGVWSFVQKPLNLYFGQLKEAGGPDLFCSPPSHMLVDFVFNILEDITLSKLPLKHFKVHKNVLQRVTPSIRPN